jgi:hypothetical protein
MLTGCTLDAPGGRPVALEPTVARPTFIAPTPYIAPTQVPQGGFSGQAVGTPIIVVTPTLDPLRILTPVPAQSLIQNPAPSATSQNAIEVVVNNIIIPTWNFIYTFILEGISTLWLFAGARGGGFAQVGCCVVPFFAAIVAVALRFRLLRWRR